MAQRKADISVAPQWQHTQWAETQGRQGAQNQQNPTEEWQGAQTQSDQQDQARSHRWQHPPGHRGDKAQDRRRELYRAKLDIKRLEDRLEEVKEQCQLEKRVMALEHQKKEQIDALKAQRKTEEDGLRAEIRTLKAKLEAEEQKKKMATAADLKPWMDAKDKFVKQEKEMTTKIDELRNERVQLKKANEALEKEVKNAKEENKIIVSFYEDEIKKAQGDMLSARFLELLAGQAAATVASGTKARFLFGAAVDLLSAQLLQVDEGEPVKKTDDNEGGPVKKTPANEARAQDSKTANVTFADQVKKDKAEKVEGPPKK
ncbi:unnamed protein product, partial [Symbiodinium pilosum]